MRSDIKKIEKNLYSGVSRQTGEYLFLDDIQFLFDKKFEAPNPTNYVTNCYSLSI